MDKKRLCAAAKTREDCQTVPQRSDGQRMGACTSSPRPPASGEGRRRKTDLREIINALRYLIRSGCSWRMLPRRIRAVANCLLVVSTTDEAFPLCNDTRYLYHARPASPEKTLAPSLAVLDSQSVKAPHASDRGIDAHKKIVGRKRHVAVDSDGRLLLVNMTPANVADSTGAQMILDAMYRKWPSVKHFLQTGPMSASH